MLRKLIKYLFLKIKWRNKLRLYFSSRIGNTSVFEGGNLIQPRASFSGYMGYGSYVATESSIHGRIGRFSSIGPFVRCNYGTHPYTYPYLSTSPWLYSDNPLKINNGPKFLKKDRFEEYQFADKENNHPIIIGNDCWIGEGAFIVGGCTIHDGAVVLAHAVVTKDVPPFSIVGGVPAKVIGYRFSKEDIERILVDPWWNKDIDWIKKNAPKLTYLTDYLHLNYNDL